MNKKNMIIGSDILLLFCIILAFALKGGIKHIITGVILVCVLLMHIRLHKSALVRHKKQEEISVKGVTAYFLMIFWCVCILSGIAVTLFEDSYWIYFIHKVFAFFAGGVSMLHAIINYKVFFSMLKRKV